MEELQQKLDELLTLVREQNALCPPITNEFGIDGQETNERAIAVWAKEASKSLLEAANVYGYCGCPLCGN